MQDKNSIECIVKKGKEMQGKIQKMKGARYKNSLTVCQSPGQPVGQLRINTDTTYRSANQDKNKIKKQSFVQK